MGALTVQGRILQRTDNSQKYLPSRAPTVAQQCPECSAAYQIGGPIWLDPIHNQEFVDRVLKKMEEGREGFASFRRVHGLVSVLRNVC